MIDREPRDIWRWRSGRWSRSADAVAAEEPLEIRVRNRSIGVTMRTPGHDGELAAGFLYTEGVVRRPDDVRHIRHCPQDPEGNIVDVTLAPQVEVDFARLTRHVYASSSCGLCGAATIEAACRNLPPLSGECSVALPTLLSLPGQMRAAQQAFDATGGLHAAALFDADGALRVLREDIGRHNAVDKVIGHCLLHNASALARAVLLVSGRASFEIVQKALAARIPVIAAVSAPSSLAVELAERSGQLLVGFLREGRLNVYTHPQRLREAPTAARAAARTGGVA